MLHPSHRTWASAPLYLFALRETVVMGTWRMCCTGCECWRQWLGLVASAMEEKRKKSHWNDTFCTELWTPLWYQSGHLSLSESYCSADSRDSVSSKLLLFLLPFGLLSPVPSQAAVNEKRDPVQRISRNHEKHLLRNQVLYRPEFPKNVLWYFKRYSWKELTWKLPNPN